MYQEIAENIELATKLIFFATCGSGIICLVPALPFSLIRYYVYDMQERSFYLFVPAWFVFTVLNEMNVFIVDEMVDLQF